VEFLVTTEAQHFPKKWTKVSSSPQAGPSWSVRTFITDRCLLSAICLVSYPTNIPSCFLPRPKAYLESCLSGPCNNILACLHPSLDCQSLQNLDSTHLRTSVWTIVGVIPITGTQPIYTKQVPCLASTSATSLPGTRWPGTRINLTCSACPYISLTLLRVKEM